MNEYLFYQIKKKQPKMILFAAGWLTTSPAFQRLSSIPADDY